MQTLPKSRGGQDLVGAKLPDLHLARWLNTGLGLPITGYTFFCGAEYGHAP